MKHSPYLIAALCLIPILTLSARADVSSAQAAFDQGHYDDAQNEVAPLAEQGDAKAELLMGSIYQAKLGAHEDSTEVAIKRNALIAEEYFLRAARQGDATAQASLSIFYLAHGTLVAAAPKPDMQAYYWSSIAMKRGASGSDVETTKQAAGSHLTDALKTKLNIAVSVWKPGARPAHELPVETVVRTPCAAGETMCLGKKAFEERNYDDARTYFEKVVAGPSQAKDRATAQSFLAEIDRVDPEKDDAEDNDSDDTAVSSTTHH